MTRVIAELAFGYTVSSTSPVWTNVTERVDLEEAVVTIRRGATDEFTETQHGTASLALDNSDGALTPLNASSPYYPHVKKNVPIRLRVVTAVKNLLTNPSFEDGVTAWTSSGTPTRAQSTTHVQDGTYAMLVTWGAVAGQTVTSPVIYGLDVGKRYTFSAYVWVPTGDAPVRLTVADVTTGSQNTVFDAFQRLTVTWTATSTSHQVRIGAIGTPAAGDLVWMDAGQIEEGAAATTFDPDGAQIHNRFWGLVNELPVTWEGLLSKVVITATDTFKVASLSPELRPMLIEEVLLDGPLAYYPMVEPADSTSAGDQSGATEPTALSIAQTGTGGTLTFDTALGPVDSLRSPTFTPVNSTNGKWLTADLGGDFQTQSTSQWIMVECWFSTAAQSRNILTVFSSNEGYYLIFYLASGTGYLTVESRDPDTGVTTTTLGATDLADSAVHHLLYDEENKTVYIDGASIGTDAGIRTMYNLRKLNVGASQNGFVLWNGSVSHVAVYATTALTAADITTHYTTGTTAHAGETSAARIVRLASYAGLTATSQGTAFSPVMRQIALGNSALDHMREIELAEGGHLFTSRSSAAIVLQSRDVRYNPLPAFTIAYADLEPGTEIAYDDLKLVNTLTGIRPEGATQRVLDAASRTANGPKEKTYTYYKTTDAQVTDALHWTLSRYADPQPELRAVTIEASSLSTATYRAILDADISSAFTVTDMPAQAPAAAMTATVEGYTETIRQGRHTLTIDTSSTGSDVVWVLDDATYSVLGTTTRLAY